MSTLEAKRSAEDSRFRIPTQRLFEAAFVLALPLTTCCISSRSATVVGPISDAGPELTGIERSFKNASWMNVGIRQIGREKLCVPSPPSLPRDAQQIAPLRLVKAGTQISAIVSLPRKVQFQRVKFRNGVAGMAELGAPDIQDVALGSDGGKSVVPRGDYRVCLYFMRGACDRLSAESANVTCSAVFELEQDSEFWKESQMKNERPMPALSSTIQNWHEVYEASERMTRVLCKGNHGAKRRGAGR